MAEEGTTAAPPYSEMILEAIDGLNEKTGSSKAKISKYIESKHGDLPSDHAEQISDQLTKMKDAGEIVFAKNNYMRPDPNSPAKRSRGRPPKPKEPLPEGYVAPAPKPRGRPPKAKDGLSAKLAKVAEGLPKRRGRPPNKQPKKAPAPAAGAKRGRGRPPKAKPAVADAVGA
ncbi:HMG-Y-related protein A-like [Wolffia australiana]